MVNDLFKSKGSVANYITDRASVQTNSAPQQNINSCSHSTGATFGTEQKPIRYSVNTALNFTANFYQRSKQETKRSTVKCFIVSAFPLSGKTIMQVRSSVLNASVLLSRGFITSPPKVKRAVGILCQFFIERTPTPYIGWK